MTKAKHKQHQKQPSTTDHAANALQQAMMDRLKEDQEQEIEALKSIYQEDFLPLIPGDDSAVITHKFAIILEPTTERVSSHVAAKMEISLSPLYPHQAPSINIIKMKGLGDVRTWFGECAMC